MHSDSKMSDFCAILSDFYPISRIKWHFKMKNDENRAEMADSKREND